VRLPETTQQPDRSLSGMSLAQASHRVLLDAGEPLHWTRIAELLQVGGVSLPAEKESARRNLVGALGRRRDLVRGIGKGRYAAVNGGKAASRGASSTHRLRAGIPQGRGSTVALIRDLVAHEPGLTSAEVADRLAAHVQSSAQNPRKLVQSVVGYLVKKKQVRKNPDGGLSLLSNPSGQLVLSTENGSGPED
jgi:hypothetical protein